MIIINLAKKSAKTNDGRLVYLSVMHLNIINSMSHTEYRSSRQLADSFVGRNHHDNVTHTYLNILRKVIGEFYIRENGKGYILSPDVIILEADTLHEYLLVNSISGAQMGSVCRKTLMEVAIENTELTFKKLPHRWFKLRKYGKIGHSTLNNKNIYNVTSK